MENAPQMGVTADKSPDPDDKARPRDVLRPMAVTMPLFRSVGREVDLDGPVPKLPPDVGDRMRGLKPELEFKPRECDGVRPERLPGVDADGVERIDCWVGLRGDRAMINRLSPSELITTTKGPRESLCVAHLSRIHQIVAENAAQYLEKPKNRRDVPVNDVIGECQRRIEELLALEKKTRENRLRLIDGALRKATVNSAEAIDLREMKRRLEESLSPP
jgi:hypothetical protein